MSPRSLRVWNSHLIMISMYIITYSVSDPVGSLSLGWTRIHFRKCWSGSETLITYLESTHVFDKVQLHPVVLFLRSYTQTQASIRTRLKTYLFFYSIDNFLIFCIVSFGSFWDYKKNSLEIITFIVFIFF